MPDFSFRLLPDFIDKYKEAEPPFGFRDAGGNSLGEITFIRTYSRVKDDGTKEKWWEVCERVINGMYTIQKDWAKNNKLPWNDNKAQTSAKEAFDRMFNLKWTPPGRGLWVTGTKLIHERNIVAGLYNCFTGDTKAITKNGVVRLDEIVGEEQEVWADGGWHRGVVSEFSQSVVNRIQFKPFFDRSNHVITVDATEDHKWILDDGTETTSLAVGDKVVASGTSVDVNSDDYHAGVIHGIVFGDGTRHSFVRSDGAKRFHVRLCGERADEMKQYFGHITYPQSANGDAQAYVLSQKELKEFPVGEGADYVGGFIYGWLLADGNGLSEDGGKLDTQNVNAYSWLSDHAAYGGYVVVGHNYHQKPTNYGDRKNPLHRITLRKSKVFKVVSITELDIQPTYCFTVPGVGKFTLASGLITGNCSFISTGDMEHRDPGAVFAWVMDALMLGVGVGFDTRGEAKGIRIGVREDSDEVYQIPDTREGWAESIRLLLNSYLRTNKKIEFDYSLIRPYGEPIKGFGGTASGPEPLIKVHRQIEHILDNRPGEVFDARAIVDMVNLIGTCVVAGNVRRSATIALGKQGDNYFIELKNYEKYPERAEWGWMCLPDDTWVHTLDGPKQIKSLINTEFVAMVNGQPYSTESVGFFSTGTRDVYRVSTKQGYSVDATDNHPILTEDGFVSVADLNVGDKIVIADQTFMTWGADDNSFAKGYVIGSIWGDGWITGNRAYICLYGDEATTNRLNELEQYAKLVGAQGAFQSPTSQNEHRLASKVLFSVAASYGFSNKGKRISAEIESESSEFYRGFLRAAFDADGTVAKYRSGAHGGQVILSQSNYQDLQAIQRMLLRLGIYSTIREASSKFGYGNKKQPYTLAVSARSLDLYVEHIGFSHEGKARRLKEILSARKIVRDIEKTYYATIDSIEWVSEREVYDVTINEKHMFDANGILVHNSNNTVVIDEPGYDYADAAQRIADNGEPGFLFLNTMQQYGRLKDAPDNKDWRVLGTNPCAEISLESRELCNLVEIHLNRHDSIEDYLRTIKFAYLYAKSITLLPTHWPETNAVIQRNRRIGTSMTGIAGFVDKHGLPEFRTWADNGYDEIQGYDKSYSEWLGIRESIRTTTVKPSGSVSLLSGATPGVHWPAGGKYYLRAVRFAANDPMLTLFRMAWYKVEKDVASENTYVVYFPVKTEMERSEKDVSLYEKIQLATEAQRYWSDNSVSVTVTFSMPSEKDEKRRAQLEEMLPEIKEKEDHYLGLVNAQTVGDDGSNMINWMRAKAHRLEIELEIQEIDNIPDERPDIERALKMHEGDLKTVSFLPMSNKTYAQMPYTEITEKEYQDYIGTLLKIDFDAVYDGVDNLEAIGSRFCDGDVCTI